MKTLLSRAVVILVVAASSLPAAAWDTNGWELVENIERANLRFFEEQKRGPYMLLIDTADNDAWTTNTWVNCSSVAGIGFELTAICLGHYRGWISYSNAYERSLLQMRAFNNLLSDDTNVFHRAEGWTHHMYTIEDCAEAEAGHPWPYVQEYSVLDHSMLVAGCIFIMEYFKGTEAAALASNIYAQTQWNLRSNDQYNFGYSENLLAIVECAEAPAYKKGTEAYNIWRDYCIPPWPRELQFYFWQYPHSWVDFRFRTDAQRGDNHAVVAEQSILYQRDCATNLHASDPVAFDMIGSNCWGWTCATASGDATHPGPDYRQMTPWPRKRDGEDYDAEHSSDSGSITPINVPGCMVYAPGETMAALKYILEEFWFKGWDPAKGERSVWNGDRYSFLNCFNKGKPYRYYSEPSVSNWFHPVNAGIDYGPNVLLLENYKLGTTWRYFMQNPYIATGMYTVGFGPPTNVTLATFTGPANQFGGGLGGWNNDATPVWTGYVDIGYVSDAVQGYVVRVGADNSNEGGWIDLNGCDQRAKAQLSFWAKCDAEQVGIEVGLVDRVTWKENKVHLQDYAGGTTPTNWTEVKIPIERFCLTGVVTNDTWPGALERVTFAFTNSGGGTIDIDSLAFTADTLAPAVPVGLGVAQGGHRARMIWDNSGRERDVSGYQVWRRFDGGSGFDRATPLLVPAYLAAHEDLRVATEPGGEVRYAVQASDNGEPQNGSVFTPEKVVTGGRLDVDWNNGSNPNVLGGNLDGYWGAPEAEAFQFIETNLPNGWNGWARRSYVSQPSGGHFIYAANQDVGDYSALGLYIKGAAGGEGLEVGLKDSTFFEIKVDLTNYLESGTLTTNWTQVVIPFGDFPGVGVTSLDNISFTHTTSGEVYIASLGFVMDRRALLSGGCFLEAEDFARQQGWTRDDFKAAASSGEVLGYGWGGDDGDYADYEFVLGRAHTGLVLSVRYACGVSDGRSLQIRWDGSGVGTLTCPQTGGWGDTSNQFGWATALLPATSAGFHKLTLYASGSDDPLNLDCLWLKDSPVGFRECEQYDSQVGSGGDDYKDGASGGEVLGDSWGVASDSEAVFDQVAVEEQTNAWFQLWYSLNAVSYTGRAVDVYVDGTLRARLMCPGTAGWGSRAHHFECASARIGALSAGSHTVLLTVPEGGTPVNLDCFYISGTAPDAVAGDSDGDGLSDREEEIAGTTTGNADSDGDGLSDGDEVQYGVHGQVSDPTKADTDGDTMDDGEEAVAGTDPNNADAFFQCLDISTPDLPMPGRVLRWPSAAGRAYSVYGSSNLVSSEFWPMTSSLPATPTVNVWTDTVTDLEGPVFYRIGVLRSP